MTTMKSSTYRPSQAGVVLLDANRRPLYYNAEAGSILSYGKNGPGRWPPAGVLPAALSSPLPPRFRSGRRQYCLRTFLLDSNGSRRRATPRFVVVLDRDCFEPLDIKRWSEWFLLTNRERETVVLLLKGLSSKQMASEMNISPSTVKSFLKLVMAKVGVSTRAEIVAKIMTDLSAGIPNSSRTSPASARR